LDLKSIFLNPHIKREVNNHHAAIIDTIRSGEALLDERMSLYDLLLKPKTGLTKERWMSIQEAWASALHNNEPETIPYELYYGPEAHIKKSLFPFLMSMKNRLIWQSITSPDADEVSIVDLTRFTVHWAVLLEVKRFWIHKGWRRQEYVGLPAMTTPVLNASVFLFGEKVKGNVLLAKTIHTKIATSIGKSEIWVNSALHVLGTK
jgi:hypothetical protein